MCCLFKEEGVDGVNIYPAEERAQVSAEATDDFKMSFSGSVPCNSAEKQITAFKSQPPQTLTTPKCHRNTEDASDSYRTIQSQLIGNTFMENPAALHDNSFPPFVIAH